MEKGWVSVFITDEEFVAELAKGLLEENDIQFVLLNKRDSSYLFGYIEIFVKRENAIRAKYLLKRINN